MALAPMHWECDAPCYEIVVASADFGYVAPADRAWHRAPADAVIMTCHQEVKAFVPRQFAYHAGEDSHVWVIWMAQCSICGTIYWR